MPLGIVSWAQVETSQTPLGTVSWAQVQVPSALGMVSWAHVEVPIISQAIGRGYWASHYWNHAYYDERYWADVTVEVEVIEVPHGLSEKRRKTRRGRKGFKNVPKVYNRPYENKEYYRVFGPYVDLDKRDEERRLEVIRIAQEAQYRALQAVRAAEDEAWLLITAIACAEDDDCHSMPEILVPDEDREAVELLVALAQL